MFKKGFFLTPLFIISYASYAAPNLDLYFTGGAAFNELSNNRSVRINSFVVNRYDAEESTSANALWGLGLGHTFQNIFNHPFNVSLSFAGYYIDYDKISGTEHPFINMGHFDTLEYQFRTQSFAAMLESRFTCAKYDWHPFLLLGIGASWNRLFDYEETPSNTDDSAAPVPNEFGSNSEANFAYEAGVGIQHELFYDAKLKVNWNVSLEYRYMQLGDAEFESFPAQTSNDSLRVDGINNQALVFTIQGSV